MLYKFPRDDFQILIEYEFSKRYLKGTIDFKEFTRWLNGFQSELEQKKVNPESIATFRQLMVANPEHLLFFEIFDGTKKSRNGEILGMILAELSKHQEILVYPVPGKQDIYGYGFVNEAIKHCYVKSRRQIDLTQLSQLLISVDIIDDNPFSNKFFIFDKDMFAPGRNNWCYGQVQPVQTFHLGEINFDMLFCSTARIDSEAMLYDLFAHEIGHMLNVALAGRSNTTEQLGSHCINPLCVMQQNVEAEQASQYAKLRQRAGAPLYCQQCLLDIKTFKSNSHLKDLLKVKFKKM